MFAAPAIVNAVEERLAENRNLISRRRDLRDRSNPFEISDSRFIELYRLDKNTVRNLIDEIRPNLRHTERVTAMSHELRVLCTLRFFATGSYQRSCGQDFLCAMAQSSVSSSIHSVTEAMERIICPQKVRFPVDPQEKQDLKRKFMDAYGFPGIIGCVDGTQIAITRPQNDGQAYMNRKNFYSKNVQIVCDFDLKIRNINANNVGSSHDAFIWRGSTVRDYLQENHANNNTWLLGDQGYPLEPWLLTPFPDAEPNSPEARYNSAHIRARNKVERCIGLLKGRFRCLLRERTAKYEPLFMGRVINVCASLHNISIEANLPPVEPVYEDNNEDLDHENINWNADIQRRGQQVRRRVVHDYFR